MNLQERIVNGLYGQAVADACGNPFEFESNIKPDAVIVYANTTDSLVISDDTQMALVGFEAIHTLNSCYGNIYKNIADAFTVSYLDWNTTQTERFDPEHHKFGLLGYESMFSVQAPGNTCLSALHDIQIGKPVKNDSMGCGSVMRLLPLISLFDPKYDLNYQELEHCAVITGELTHKHRLNRPAIEAYMAAARNILFNKKVICPPADSISELGEGWIAPECVAMAIWAYCHSESFDELLSRSIAHNGDSDSVAAIAGSLWGLSGREVPQKYIDKLDALDAIKYVIANL